jgi:hypothetical protein
MPRRDDLPGRPVTVPCQQATLARQHRCRRIAHTLANLCPYQKPAMRFRSGEKPGHIAWGAWGSNPEPTD